MLALPGRAEDDDAWMIYSEGLSEAGIMAMEVAEAQDKEAFFQAMAGSSIAFAQHAISPTVPM